MAVEDLSVAHVVPSEVVESADAFQQWALGALEARLLELQSYGATILLDSLTLEELTNDQLAHSVVDVSTPDGFTWARATADVRYLERDTETGELISDGSEDPYSIKAERADQGSITDVRPADLPAPPEVP